ncbi:unnamed protein product, partial [Symbiodinium sp. CCMP2456]
MHGKNVEFFCANAPGKAYLAGEMSLGFADVPATSGMWGFVLICRLTQRRAVVLEMPVAYGTHSDKNMVIDLMRWAGFTVVWEGYLDPCQMVPLHRRRHYTVFWNSADAGSVGKPFRMIRLGDRGDLACNDVIWSNMPGTTLDAIRVKGASLTKLNCRELLPKYMQHRQGSALQIRLLDQSKPMPPFGASHGELLRLPWPMLRTRGLHMAILEPQPDVVRLISKWEALGAMGLPIDTILPEPESDAFAILGEGTIPAAAMVILASVIGHRHEDPMQEDELINYVDEGNHEADGLRGTYMDSHSSRPDIITLNGRMIESFPICFSMGDFLRLRWGNHSDHEWEEVDIFKKVELPEIGPLEPSENNESSE